MASKRKPPTKKAPTGKGINIDINLGSRTLTKKQTELLKKYIKGQVLTWIKDDVGETPRPVITFNEFPRPTGGGGS